MYLIFILFRADLISTDAFLIQIVNMIHIWKSLLSSGKFLRESGRRDIKRHRGVALENRVILRRRVAIVLTVRWLRRKLYWLKAFFEMFTTSGKRKRGKGRGSRDIYDRDSDKCCCACIFKNCVKIQKHLHKLLAKK